MQCKRYFMSAAFSQSGGVLRAAGEGSSLRNPRSYRARVRRAMQSAQQQESYFEEQAMSANLYGSSVEEGDNISVGGGGRERSRPRHFSGSRLPKSKRQRVSHHRLEHVGKEVAEKAKFLSDNEWEGVPLEDKHAFTQYMSRQLREFPTQTTEQQRRRYFETTLADPRDMPAATETVKDAYERVKLGLPVQMKHLKRGLGVPDAVYHNMSDASLFEPEKSHELEEYMIQIKQLFADYVQHRKEGKSTEAERRRLALMTREFHEQTQQHLGNMFKYAEERIRKVAEEERMQQWEELEALKAFCRKKRREKKADNTPSAASSSTVEPAAAAAAAQDGEDGVDKREEHDGGEPEILGTGRKDPDWGAGEGKGVQPSDSSNADTGDATLQSSSNNTGSLLECPLYDQIVRTQPPLPHQHKQEQQEVSSLHPKKKRHSTRVKQFLRQALGVDPNVASSIWQELDTQLKFMSFCEVFARLTVKKGFMHTEVDEGLDAYTERMKKLYSVDAGQWSTLEVVQYLAAKESTMPVEWARRWYERLLRIPLQQVPEYKRLEEMRKEEMEAMELGKKTSLMTSSMSSSSTATTSTSRRRTSDYHINSTEENKDEPERKDEQERAFREDLKGVEGWGEGERGEFTSLQPVGIGGSEKEDPKIKVEEKQEEHVSTSSSTSSFLEKKKKKGKLPLEETISEEERQEAERRERVAVDLTNAAIDQQQGKVIKLVEKMFLKPEDPHWETLHEKRLRYLAYLQMEEQIRQARVNTRRYAGIEESEEGERCRQLYQALLERGERYRRQQCGGGGLQEEEDQQKKKDGRGEEEAGEEDNAAPSSSLTAKMGRTGGKAEGGGGGERGGVTSVSNGGDGTGSSSSSSSSILGPLPEDLFAKDVEAVKIFDEIRDTVISVMKRHHRQVGEGKEDHYTTTHRSGRTPAEQRKAKLEEAAQELRENLAARSQSFHLTKALEKKRQALADRLISIAEKDIKSELDWISAMEEAERPPLLPVPLERDAMSYISVADVQAWREAREGQQTARHSPFAPAQRRRERELAIMRKREQAGQFKKGKEGEGEPTALLTGSMDSSKTSTVDSTTASPAEARSIGANFTASFLGQPWEIPNKPTLFWGTGVRAVQQALEQAAEDAMHRRVSKEILPPPYPCAVNPWGWRLVKDVLDD